MKTLFNTLSDTNYNTFNSKRFLFQDAQKTAPESTDIQKGNELSIATLKESKQQQIGCIKDCFAGMAEEAKYLPNYSKNTESYIKKTTSSETTYTSETIDVPFDGKSTEIQKYVVDCVSGQCIDNNKLSTVSGVADSLGFDLSEGNLVSINGQAPEPIHYEKNKKEENVKNAENLSGDCKYVSVPFKHSNFDRIYPGQHAYVVDGVLHISDTKPSGTVQKTILTPNTTVGTTTYYKKNESGIYSKIDDPHLKFDANGQYEENKYYQEIDGVKTEINKSAYEQGLKIKEDKKQFDALTDKDKKAKDILKTTDLNGIGSKEVREKRSADSLKTATKSLDKYSKVMKKLFKEQSEKLHRSIATAVERSVNEGGGIISLQDGLVGAIAGIVNKGFGGNIGGEDLQKSMDLGDKDIAAINKKVESDAQKLVNAMSEEAKNKPSAFWKTTANVLKFANRYSALATAVFSPVIHLANLKVSKQAYRVNWDNYLLGKGESFSGAMSDSVKDVRQHILEHDNLQKLDGEAKVNDGLLKKLGLVIDEEGNIAEDRAKDKQRLAFNFWERIGNKNSGDVRRARRVLLEKGKKGASSVDKIDLNRRKAAALAQISDIIKKENMEDIMDRKVQKNVPESVLLNLTEKLYATDPEDPKFIEHLGISAAKVCKGFTKEQKTALGITDADITAMENPETDNEELRTILKKLYKNKFLKKKEFVDEKNRLVGRIGMIQGLEAAENHFADMADNQAKLEARKIVESVADAESGLSAEKSFVFLESQIDNGDEKIDSAKGAKNKVSHLLEKYGYEEAINISEDLSTLLESYYAEENIEARAQKMNALMISEDFKNLMNTISGNVETANSLEGIDQDCLIKCFLKAKDAKYSSNDMIVYRKTGIPLMIPKTMIMDLFKEVETPETYNGYIGKPKSNYKNMFVTETQYNEFSDAVKQKFEQVINNTAEELAVKGITTSALDIFAQTGEAFGENYFTAAFTSLVPDGSKIALKYGVGETALVTAGLIGLNVAANNMEGSEPKKDKKIISDKKAKRLVKRLSSKIEDGQNLYAIANKYSAEIKQLQNYYANNIDKSVPDYFSEISKYALQNEKLASSKVSNKEFKSIKKQFDALNKDSDRSLYIANRYPKELKRMNIYYKANPEEATPLYFEAAMTWLKRNEESENNK